MPEGDFHPSDYAHSQAHDSRLRGNDILIVLLSIFLVTVSHHGSTISTRISWSMRTVNFPCDIIIKKEKR